MICRDCGSAAIDIAGKVPECTLCGGTDIPVITPKNYDGFVLITAHAEYPCNWCSRIIYFGQPIYRRSTKMRFDTNECVETWLLFQELRKEGIVAVSKKEGNCHTCKKYIPVGWYHWYSRSLKFCTEKCHKAHKQTIKTTGIKGVCTLCDEEFDKIRENQKFCSSKCYRKNQSKNWEKDAPSAQ